MKADNNKIDSLRRIIDNTIKCDSTTVDLLFVLSESYFSISLDSGLQIDKKALELSKRLNYKKGINRSYLRIGRWYSYLGNYTESLNNYRISISKAKDNSHTFFLSKSYALIGMVFARTFMPDSVYHYFKLFNALPDEYKSNQDIYNNYLSLYQVYIHYGMYDRAHKYFVKTVELFKGKKLPADNIIQFYNTQAVCSVNDLNYVEAEKFCIEAKKYLTICTPNMKEYFEIGIDINYSLAIAGLKRNQEAISILKRTLKVSEDKGYGDFMLFSYSNLEYIYRNIGQIDSSDYYLQKLGGNIKNAPTDFVLGYYSGLFSNNYIRGNKKESEYYLEKANKLYDKTQSPIIKLLFCKEIIKVFIKGEDYKNAFRYSELARNLSDSIKNEQNRLNLSFLQIDFEVDKKNREIENLQVKSELQQTTIQRNRLIALLISSGLLLGLFVSGFIILSLNRKKKTTEILLRKNEELANQKYLTLYRDSQIMAIREKIAGQEEERSRIARELHDGIGGTLAAVKMRLEKVDHQPNPEDMASLVSMVASSWEEVRTISHHLMPPQFEEVSIDRVLQNHIRELNKSNKIDFTIQFLPKVGWEKIPADLQVELYRVVQELCTNIIKYSNATTVEIQLSQLEGSITLTMEDNGAPFIYSSKGIGYRNLQERIKLFNGSFEKSTGNNQGNTYLVQIPFAFIKA